MVDAERLVARIDAVKRQIGQHQAALRAVAEAIGASIDAHGAASAEAEDLSEQLAAFGIEDRARLALDVHDTLDGSQTTAVDWKQAVENKAAEGDAITAILDAARAIAVQLSGGTAAAEAPESSWRNEVGEKLQPGPESPHRRFFKKELDGSDDADKTRSQRFGRRLVASADNLKSAGKEIGQAGTATVAAHDPHTYGQETVQVPRGMPTISPQGHDAVATDFLGTAVILSAVAFEGISRLTRRKRRGK